MSVENCPHSVPVEMWISCLLWHLPVFPVISVGNYTLLTFLLTVNLKELLPKYFFISGFTENTLHPFTATSA